MGWRVRCLTAHIWWHPHCNHWPCCRAIFGKKPVARVRRVHECISSTWRGCAASVPMRRRPVAGATSECIHGARMLCAYAGGGTWCECPFASAVHRVSDVALSQCLRQKPGKSREMVVMTTKLLIFMCGMQKRSKKKLNFLVSTREQWLSLNFPLLANGS